MGGEFVALLMMASFVLRTLEFILQCRIQFFSTARIFTSLNIELVVIQDSFNCERGLQKGGLPGIRLEV